MAKNLKHVIPTSYLHCTCTYKDGRVLYILCIPVQVDASGDGLPGVLTLVVAQLKAFRQDEEPLPTNPPLLYQPTYIHRNQGEVNNYYLHDVCLIEQKGIRLTDKEACRLHVHVHVHCSALGKHQLPGKRLYTLKKLVDTLLLLFSSSVYMNSKTRVMDKSVLRTDLS